MPEITRIRTISKQTHLNRVPLETDIIQAPHPCKQQMNSTVLIAIPATGHPGRMGHFWTACHESRYGCFHQRQNLNPDAPVQTTCRFSILSFGWCFAAAPV